MRDLQKVYHKILQFQEDASKAQGYFLLPSSAVLSLRLWPLKLNCPPPTLVLASDSASLVMSSDAIFPVFPKVKNCQLKEMVIIKTL